MSATDTSTTNVSAIVRLLLGGTTRPARNLARALNVHESTMSRRLRKDSHIPWSIDEVTAAARFFGVPVSTFFRDPRSIYEELGLDLDGRPLASPPVIECEPLIFQPELFDALEADEEIIDLRRQAVPVAQHSHLVHAA